MQTTAQTNDSGHVAVNLAAPGPDAEGFRYILMWMQSLHDASQGAMASHVMEWLEFTKATQALLIERERDAARYRWLRDSANKVLDRAPIVVMADVELNVGYGDIRTGPRLDGAIDAELAKAGVNN